jgi:hypothetical protein
MRSNVIDDNDVRMIERAGSLGFLLEASQTIFAGRERSRQNFDGDIAPVFRIARARQTSPMPPSPIFETMVY